MRKVLSFLVKRVFSWPVLIIIGLNLENWATERGLSDLVPEGWTVISSIWAFLYDFALNSAVLNVALVLLGAILYEWIALTFSKLDRPGSKAYRWRTKNVAEHVANIMRKDGFLRKYGNPDGTTEELNARLAFYGLPEVPPRPTQSDKLNDLWSRYLMIVAEGDFEMAKQFIHGMQGYAKSLDQPPLLPTESAEERQRKTSRD